MDPNHSKAVDSLKKELRWFVGAALIAFIAS
jgi:hypothetical protein